MAHKANAFRVLEELQAAAEASREADRLWLNGREQQFPAYRAWALRLRTSLAVDRRCFRLALDSLAEARGLAAEALDLPWTFTAELDLNESFTYLCMDRPDQALAPAKAAARALAVEGARHLSLIARQHQLIALTGLGRYAEAADLLPHVRGLAAEHGTRNDRLRVVWAEGQVAAGTGDPETAAKHLAAVRRGFLDDGQGFAAAVVSLELARVYFNTGKLALVRQLALEMVPVFEAKDVHKDAQSALSLFQRAALLEQVTDKLLEEVLGYLRRAMFNPKLRFRAAS